MNIKNESSNADVCSLAKRAWIMCACVMSFKVRYEFYFHTILFLCLQPQLRQQLQTLDKAKLGI